MLTFLQERLPATGNDRLRCGHCKVIQPVPDELLSRESQKFPGAHTGRPIGAVVVRNYDGRDGVKDDRPEKAFEFFRTIFGEPSGGLRLGSNGGQSVFLLSSSSRKTLSSRLKQREMAAQELTYHEFAGY
jgi:hypothetical protein